MRNQSHVRLTTTQLIDACQQEFQQSYKQERGYCFALFCRAFEQEDALAWEAIQQQYERMMRSWVRKTAVNLTSSEENDLLQESWYRFCRLSKQKPGKIRDHFPHAGALLRYLRCCVQSAALDLQRERQRQAALQKDLRTNPHEKSGQTGLWEREKARQRQAVRQYIAQQVHDPQEQTVLYLSYQLGLKNRQIVASHPNEFASVKEVKRVKERVLKRMRRALL